MSVITDPIWVTSAESLAQRVPKWQNAGTLCVDTEFLRERTFYPILALIQIFDGDQVFLIEPDAAKNSDEFKALFSNQSVKKIFHSASEDCEVLFRSLGVTLKNLWDSQIAAAYLGLGTQLGYGQLVEQLLGIALEKAEARSDWLKRPLTDKQIEYACGDVVYLWQCYEKQASQLMEGDILRLRIEQDSKQLAQRVADLDDVDAAYLDIKNAWRLSGGPLHRLRALAIWREQLARELDRPRPFIANNQVLFEIAQHGLDDNERLPHVKDWHPAAKRKYSAPAVKCLLALNDSDSSEPVEQPLSPKFWQSYTQKLQQARDKMLAIAKDEPLDIDVLCSKKLLRGYVKFLMNKSTHPPRNWTLWREELLGDLLREIFVSDRRVAARQFE